MYKYYSEIKTYLTYCECQKNLNEKTLKAYRIDLEQFFRNFNKINNKLEKPTINEYITYLHKHYKPKTVKRKIATLKAFCNYLENEEILELNPFSKIKVLYREPFNLPKVITLCEIDQLLRSMYVELDECKTVYTKRILLRDIATVELLFATGIRVSELCTLLKKNVDLNNKVIRIFGKGARERILQIENKEVLDSLWKYYSFNKISINKDDYFFVNRIGNRLSEQSVRSALNNYCMKANINKHITPHMIRHTFATLLLEEDVDIRYIQRMLGHSSITTTQIYTHVTSSKQKEILLTKHPRNKLMCR